MGMDYLPSFEACHGSNDGGKMREKTEVKKKTGRERIMIAIIKFKMASMILSTTLLSL